VRPLPAWCCPVGTKGVCGLLLLFTRASGGDLTDVEKRGPRLSALVPVAALMALGAPVPVARAESEAYDRTMSCSGRSANPYI